MATSALREALVGAYLVGALGHLVDQGVDGGVQVFHGRLAGLQLDDGLGQQSLAVEGGL